jgi:hypothetical protein
MKAQVYDTTIAITVNNMLATKCRCKSGSKDGDRVVCIHNLPVAYKVTELLYDGLAEHILLELTSYIASLCQQWANDIKSLVKESVMTLMEAAGDMISCADQSIQLDYQLEQFLTGTEKAKVWGLPIKMNSSVQGPIDMLCLDSLAKKAKKLKDYNKATWTKQHDKVAKIAHNEVNVTDQMFVPQYLRVSLLMAATGKGVGGHQTGIRFLEMRINNQKNVIKLWAITDL